MSEPLCRHCGQIEGQHGAVTRLCAIQATPTFFRPVEESTAPSHGDQHPAALCLHSINNAAQIVRFQTERAEGDEVRVDALRVCELLADAGTSLGALYELFKRQERLIEDLRVENVRLARCNDHLSATDTENKERLAAAEREKEEIVRDLATLVDRSTDVFRRMNAIKFFRRNPANPGNGEYQRPRGASPMIITEPPHTAAGVSTI